MRDLHLLPKVRDSLSTLYLERARIDRKESSIVAHTEDGRIPIPAASLAVLMLGPGTSITHAAINVLADSNCLVIWCGEQNVRFYASGMGGTRNARPLLLQANLACDETNRLQVVRRMYEARFGEELDPDLEIAQLRGMEGARVRDAYARLAEETGVGWSGRSYDRTDWGSSDTVNRAISAANACLYGVCHAAILSAGFSPAIGFLHTGKQLSFVYDIADLYKIDVTLPLAFRAAAETEQGIGSVVRRACRNAFRELKLLRRIVPDIQNVLGLKTETQDESPIDSDPALPLDLWEPTEEGTRWSS